MAFGHFQRKQSDPGMAVDLDGRPGSSPRGPGPPSASRESSPRRALGRVPGRVRVSKSPRALPLGRRHWRRARREPRDTHRAPAAPPGPERKAREATQVPPQRRRKFESRSGKGPRLPAAPAHRQPLGCRGAASCERGPRGPQPARAFPVLSRKSGPSRAGAASGGGRETGRADQEFFQWVETRAGGWNPAIGSLAGAGGNLAALRAGTRGKSWDGGGGARALLMINAADVSPNL
nr:putative HTLV-1-related endogenous sequence [Ovis aries]